MGQCAVFSSNARARYPQHQFYLALQWHSMFLYYIHPDLFVNMAWAKQTNIVNHPSICFHISTKSSYSRKRIIYLRSAKIGDSRDIYFTSKSLKMRKLKFFFFKFPPSFSLFSKYQDAEMKCSMISSICWRK